MPGVCFVLPSQDARRNTDHGRSCTTGLLDNFEWYVSNSKGVPNELSDDQGGRVVLFNVFERALPGGAVFFFCRLQSGWRVY